MASEAEKAVTALREQGRTSSQIRVELLQKGFLEDEVDDALREQTSRQGDRTTNRVLTAKEVFDRIGYGFASPQFLNILFLQSGASLFLVGLFNGLKTVLSLLLSSCAQEYAKLHTIPKSRIANAGLVFGFSFFLMAFARLAHLPLLFGFAFLIGALGVVSYGDLFNRLLREMISHERRSHFLRKIASYGVLITAVSILLSGLLIDKLPGTKISVLGVTFSCYGFLISFMITAFAFILSANVIGRLQDPREQHVTPLGHFLREHRKAVWRQAKSFLGNPHIFLLLLATVVAGLLHVLGASYYGIYLYKTFKDHVVLGSFSGPFVNVAFLFTIALLASLLGPYFTKRVEKSTGLTPHLVFGTLLTAMLPLVLVYNRSYYAVMAALVCSVIGSAVVGVAQGLIAHKIMDRTTRRAFFVTQGFLVAVPYLLLVPVGAWIAQAYGLETVFLVVGFGLAVVVAPLYFILVTVTNRARL